MIPRMATLSRPRIVAVLALVIAAAATLAARQNAQAPVFRDSTDLVRVEFLALSKAGEPVPDLKPADLSVRMNGRERSIAMLQFVSLAEGGRRDSSDILPPAFGTNSASEQGRSILLLLDDDSIGPGDEERVRESVAHLLDGLAARDRVALMTAPFGVVKVNFTNDRARITQALAQITGRAPSRITFSDFGCRTRQTLDSFNGAIRSFRRGDGLPVVIVISGGIMEPRRDAGRIAAPNPVTGERPASAPEPCDVLYDDYKKLRETAGSSGLHFFVARADRRTVPPSVDDGAGRSTNIVAGLEHLASALNAPLINLHGSDGTPVLRVLQRTAGYYLLGFAPDSTDRTGEPRPLELRTGRSGISLHAPISISVPRPAANPGAPPAGAAELLKVTNVFRDLPMRATALVSRDNPDNTLKIVGLGEPIDPNVTIASGAIGLVDANGRLAAQWILDPNTPSPARMIAVFTGPGGSYRLRVAAIDSLGRTGTADYDFTAELTAAGSVRLSDIVLGVAREAGFSPVLAFGNEVAATAFLELYGAQPGVNVRAAFDIAETVNGPAVRSQVAVFAATDQPDRFVATAVLPIGTLPPGDYIVRAAVAIEKQPVTRVVRAMRKIAK